MPRLAIVADRVEIVPPPESSVVTNTFLASSAVVSYMPTASISIIRMEKGAEKL